MNADGTFALHQNANLFTSPGLTRRKPSSSWTNEYDTLLDTLVPAATMVFVEANQHPRCTCPVETRNARMTKELKEKIPRMRF